MTNPPSSAPDSDARSQPEVKPEVIKDLDVAGDDVKDIVGGDSIPTYTCKAVMHSIFPP